MKRLDGVRDASVSLDNGLAHVKFESDHAATLKSIRVAISESGFSAEEAKVQVSGTLRQNGDAWLLLAGGEAFALTSTPDTAEEDRVVTLTGCVAKNKPLDSDIWILDVDSSLE